MKWFKRILAAIALLLTVVVLVAWYIGSARWYTPKELPAPIAASRPVLISDANNTEQQSRILFGDLHVHTSISLDAHLFGSPLMKNSGTFSVADACDFARYCSALDFWSINDHAESISPQQWQYTRDTVRDCNASAGDPNNPDMVTFLGWEWSQDGMSGGEHYGHKNVIVRDIEESRVPLRPIASGKTVWYQIADAPTPLRGLGLLAASGISQLDEFGSLAAHMAEMDAVIDCPEGDVNSLPGDCYEMAESPAELFAKLDEWGLPALVIPHGMAWGTTNPASADFAKQAAQHNPRYQRLLEIYSGHGNSEVFRDMAIPQVVDDEPLCPTPSDDYLPCCWQAGEIIASRCDHDDPMVCDQRAAEARLNYVLADTGSTGSPARLVVPGAAPQDWAACDQLTDSFQPAHNYRPKQSAQYIATLGTGQPRDGSDRVRMGFIGSSDIHTGRPGTGFKELERPHFTDSKGTPVSLPAPEDVRDESLSASEVSMIDAFTKGDENDSFYYTGGLVAVHAASNSRADLWDALYARSVYGTSGPRIQLWFDLIQRDGSKAPMGSEVWSVGNPRFSVKALGSRKQRPGCPQYSAAALGEDRLQRLCRNECYYPGDERYAIDRIEIVRMMPALADNKDTQSLIQDPWRVIDCSTSGSVCEAEFEDPEFGSQGREIAYYARVIQEPRPTINGDPLRCEMDDAGQCITRDYCINRDESDDCLSPVGPRAWSSPIYVSFAGE
ncbi:MAG: DUF3604 domain-containing protein [Pseudomonadales bacterium]